MIAPFRDHRLQLWEYRISHGFLLVRSPRPRGRGQHRLVFTGVDYLPRLATYLAWSSSTGQRRTVPHYELRRAALKRDASACCLREVADT